MLKKTTEDIITSMQVANMYCSWCTEALYFDPDWQWSDDPGCCNYCGNWILESGDEH